MIELRIGRDLSDDRAVALDRGCGFVAFEDRQARALPDHNEDPRHVRARCTAAADKGNFDRRLELRAGCNLDDDAIAGHRRIIGNDRVFAAGLRIKARHECIVGGHQPVTQRRDGKACGNKAGCRDKEAVRDDNAQHAIAHVIDDAHGRLCGDRIGLPQRAAQVRVVPGLDAATRQAAFVKMIEGTRAAATH